MSKPLVSAIIAVKDGERYLSQAIDSVLSQDYPSVELIIVDSHSTDGTADIIRACPQARYVKQVNYGVAGAWNAGIAAANGDFIALLCHDDLWTPNKLTTQVNYLDSHPDIQCVFGRIIYFLEPGFPVPTGFKPHLLQGDHAGPLPQTLMARRAVFDVAPFNPEYQITEDAEWLARVTDLGIPMAMLPEVMCRVRLHDSNLTYTRPEGQRNLLRIARESLRRKQARQRRSPLVSVVLPVYNGEDYLRAAIESVLAQHHRPLELIIVDDGSTDGTLPIAESYSSRVQVIRQENSGVGAALNRGLEAAEGDFLAVIAADDLWTEDKLTIQLACFEQNPDLDMVFGHVQQFLSADLDPSVAQRLSCPPTPMPGCHAGVMLIRRAAFLRVGYFDTRWTFGEFLDWYARAKDAGLQEAMPAQTVYKRRIHGQNLSQRNPTARSDFASVIKQVLDRRRAQGRAEEALGGR